MLIRGSLTAQVQPIRLHLAAAPVRLELSRTTVISHRLLVVQETVAVRLRQRVSLPMHHPLGRSANPWIQTGTCESRRKCTAFVKYKVFGESIPIPSC